VGLQSAEVSLAPPPPKRHFDFTPKQPGHPHELGWPPHILSQVNPRHCQNVAVETQNFLTR